MAYFNRQDFTKALSDFSQTVQLNPEDAESHNNKGLINAILGNTAQALANFEKVFGSMT